MVCYVYNCNYVKVIPMKSRSASEWVKAYDTIHQELTVKGFKPKLQTLDKEASVALKRRDKRDHKQQLTHTTSSTRHYLLGWSRLGLYAHHLRGCPLALGDSFPATCPKTTSAKWTQPT
jgi:hypothetical protein